MCEKYINKYGTVFLWCEVLNGNMYGPDYLHCFSDCVDGYYDNFNYCPYCGKELLKKSSHDYQERFEENEKER